MVLMVLRVSETPSYVIKSKHRPQYIYFKVASLTSQCTNLASCIYVRFKETLTFVCLLLCNPYSFGVDGFDFDEF